jgi:hypothetical protein
MANLLDRAAGAIQQDVLAARPGKERDLDGLSDDTLRNVIDSYGKPFDGPEHSLLSTLERQRKAYDAVSTGDERPGPDKFRIIDALRAQLLLMRRAKLAVRRVGGWRRRRWGAGAGGRRRPLGCRKASTGGGAAALWTGLSTRVRHLATPPPKKQGSRSEGGEAVLPRHPQQQQSEAHQQQHQVQLLQQVGGQTRGQRECPVVTAQGGGVQERQRSILNYAWGSRIAWVMPPAHSLLHSLLDCRQPPAHSPAPVHFGTPQAPTR